MDAIGWDVGPFEDILAAFYSPFLRDMPLLNGSQNSIQLLDCNCLRHGSWRHSPPFPIVTIVSDVCLKNGVRDRLILFFF